VTENYELDVTAVQLHGLPSGPSAPGTLAFGPDGAVAPFARIPVPPRHRPALPITDATRPN
jgi:hypothetical protein